VQLNALGGISDRKLDTRIPSPRHRLSQKRSSSYSAILHDLLEHGDVAGWDAVGRTLITLAIDDRLLERLLTFDAGSEDLEDGGDGEPDGDTEADGAGPASWSICTWRDGTRSRPCRWLATFAADVCASELTVANGRSRVVRYLLRDPLAGQPGAAAADRPSADAAGWATAQEADRDLCQLPLPSEGLDPNPPSVAKVE
jgi:hypothetical protein